jgi:hypothetical protein
MWEAIAGIAAAVAAAVGLTLYLLQQRSTPAARYREACDAYKEALEHESQVQAELEGQLEQSIPDRDLFRRLSDDLAVASARVRAARAERDRLRP